MHEIEKMRDAVLKLGDPDSGYTIQDFDREFSNTNTTMFIHEDLKADAFKKKIKFINASVNENPKYETSGSSGFDIRASLFAQMTLKPLERAMVPTGLFFELPENTEIQVRPRSGLAAKHGVTVLNTPGTVDSDYRGEVKVILINLGSEDFTISNGDRIAQGVVATVMADNFVKLTQVTEISTNTTRGAGGFGHTGSN